MKILIQVKKLATFAATYIFKQFSKLFNTYKEHKFLYAILTCIFIFFAYVLIKLIHININNPFLYIVNEFNTNNEIISQHIFIKGILLENLSILISCLLIPTGGIWALHQYTKNIKFNQQNKGANIAKEFANRKIEEVGIVNAVFNRFKYKDEFIKRISKFEKINFNKYEMNKIF